MWKLYNEIWVFFYWYAPFKLIYPWFIKCWWIDKNLKELPNNDYISSPVWK